MALADALGGVGVRLAPAARGADLAIDLDGGRTVQIEVKALANASPARVRRMLAGAERRRDRLQVLVADAIPRPSRDALDRAGWGWYDRRGHLRMQAPGLYLDTDSMAAVRPPGARSAVAGVAGLVVAYELLRSPSEPLAVRRTAAAAGLNPSSISRALARLREAALVQPDGRPLVPELFWAVADVWPRQATVLKREPDPEDPVVAGCVLGGTRAAVAWGAPLVATAATPVELLLPSAGAVRRAQQRFGNPASVLTAAATIRTAPVPAVLESPVSRPAEPWPLAHPLAVALDLATDTTRGAEIVESWTPPPPYARVW